MRDVLIASAVAVLAASNPALAQRVRGTLTDSATHEPIPGAVVSISDSAGRFLARGVAGADGRFDVPRFDGSRRIHVVRIGYRPIDATVAPGDEPLALQMRAIASQLATVTTAGQRVCPGDRGNSQALELWEQVRAGFFASVVARQARPPTLGLVFYRVERDPVLKRVEDDSTWTKNVEGNESFVAARSASAFASDGYMQEHASGERDFYAPDESVLLDPSFAGSHCLRVTPADAAHPNQVGLAFEPVDAERDSIVDIRGAVWLDRAHLDLRSLDFEYTNLEPVKGGSGGTISFQLMPTGVPMIVLWTIHSPIIATESETSPGGIRRSLPPRPSRTRFRILGYQETGGQVRRASWPDGSGWVPRLPSITGLVVDLRGRVVRDARVWMTGLPDTAITDSMGVFRLTRPTVTGLFTIVAADSTLAPGSINQTPPRQVLISSERSPTRDIDIDILKMYPRADALREVCPDGKYDPGMGVAVVRVTDSLGTIAVGARVEMETRARVVAGDTVARPVRRSGEIGPIGAFVVCGAALDQPMTFRASRDGTHGEAAVERWTSDVMIVAITLRAGPL